MGFDPILWERLGTP